MAKHRQGDIHSLETEKQNIILHDNARQSPHTAMVITESQTARASTATDQYHHSETIWRVILDIISLIICKLNMFF
jgi:hypothetical protein